MDSELEFLFAGFAVVWAGLFVYLVLLQMRLRSLHQEVETLEERLAEYEGSADPPPAVTVTPATNTAATNSEAASAASASDP
jgi:CcmD family protein